jgi:beta-lactamase class A
MYRNKSRLHQRGGQAAFDVLRWMSLSALAVAVGLVIFQLIAFSRVWAGYPTGLSIAGIPVGRLDRQEAAERLLEVYSLPVELIYQDQLIHLQPSTVSFKLEVESMLAAAEMERTRTPFWNAFWDYIWGRVTAPVDIPLRLSYSQQQLQDYLAKQVATRYDQPAAPARPIPGTVNFQPGVEGTALDIERSLVLIDVALRSNTNRRVSLPLQRNSPERPSWRQLEILLKQTILDVNGFDGTVGMYLADLQNGQEISLIYSEGQLVAVPPDQSFTASSTIKIPIMVSAFRRLGPEEETDILPTPAILEQVEKMISRSDNNSSDWVMQNVIDRSRGPLVVSEDMQALGLENTFLAGYFYQGAPLLIRYQTSGQRTDTAVERDPYSQTTAAEMGQVLVDIYHCANMGGGNLVAVYPGQITQSECQSMIQQLINDRTPWLITAGLPDGTEVAHKHGWVADQFGIIHDMSDAGIVFTTGGNYVLSIFLYHPVQLVFEPSNQLVVDISRAIYNFYNLP